MLCHLFKKFSQNTAVVLTYDETGSVSVGQFSLIKSQGALSENSSYDYQNDEFELNVQ